MALHKKDFGLIYNDDGSLCVTIREDDVPFAGVRSIAVEEGTTNYCSDADPKIGDTNDSIYIEAEGYYGTDCSARYKDIAHFNYPDTLTAGTYVTAQVELKVYGGTSGISTNLYGGDLPSPGLRWQSYYTAQLIRLSDGVTVATGSNAFVIPKDNRWYRLIATWPLQTDVTNPHWRFENGGPTESNKYLLHRNAQLEIKRFPTSFVVGTRIAGKLALFDDTTVRNWTNTGIVISSWYKLNAAASTIYDFRLFSCTQSGGFNVEHLNGDDLRLAINDGGSYKYDYFDNPTIFDDLDWHFVVFYYDADTKTAKVYVDGIEQASITLTTGLHFNPNYDYFLAIGHEYPTGSQLNGLISSLFIGQYDSNIWTVEYIQELYNARKPFSTPPRMPVV